MPLALVRLPSGASKDTRPCSLNLLNYRYPDFERHEWRPTPEVLRIRLTFREVMIRSSSNSTREEVRWARKLPLVSKKRERRLPALRTLHEDPFWTRTLVCLTQIISSNSYDFPRSLSAILRADSGDSGRMTRTCAPTADAPGICANCATLRATRLEAGCREDTGTGL